MHAWLFRSTEKNFEVTTHHELGQQIMYANIVTALYIPNYNICNVLTTALYTGTSLKEKNYWADNSYYSELKVTIHGQ